MGLLEALLALIGLVALGSIVTRWYLRTPDPPPEEDLAAPYREALHTAVHLQHAAWKAERQLYAEAVRHKDSPDVQP